jgi:hypothetical protein
MFVYIPNAGVFPNASGGGLYLFFQIKIALMRKFVMTKKRVSKLNRVSAFTLLRVSDEGRRHYHLLFFFGPWALPQK